MLVQCVSVEPPLGLGKGWSSPPLASAARLEERWRRWWRWWKVQCKGRDRL